jgi:hypothetical protein
VDGLIGGKDAKIRMHHEFKKKRGAKIRMYHEFKKKREVGHDRAVASLESRKGVTWTFSLGGSRAEHNGKKNEELDRIGLWLLS